MVLLLTAAEPLGGCLVGAVSCSEAIVAATDGQVACYTAPRPTAVAGGSGLVTSADPAPPHRVWQHRVVGGRVEHAALLASDGSAYLLVTTHGEAAPPQAAVVTLTGPGAAPALAVQIELGGGDTEEEEDSAAPHVEPATHPTFSNLARCPAGGFLLAASLRLGTVHLFRAERAAGGSWELSCSATRLCDRVTMEPGSTIAVESLALGPASAHLAAGRPPHLHVAILYCSHRLGGGSRVKHVACLEVHQGHWLRSCAWFHRNVHPSTSLVAALPGARMLVAASEGLALVRADAPQDRQLVPARLRGRPTSAAALSQRLAVVACSGGQLLLLDLHRLEAAPVGTGLLSAAPTCLAFLPVAGEAAEQAAVLAAAEAEAGAPVPAVPAGLLFVGSSSGSSAFLELPAWQTVPAGDTAQLAASVAPISSACLFEDDCGDGRLLACCGQPPFARLALGRLAAGLSPLASGGGDLSGLVRLLGLQASPAGPCHRYLLLSCDDPAATAGPGGSGGWTMALEAEGGELRSAVLPGLQGDAATLLASPLPGGALLQVMPQGARVFKPSAGGATASSWSPPGGAHVSLAAQQGQYLALACGALLQVLYCGGTGRLQEECRLELPQQASALALFQLGGAGQEGGEVWLAVGLWLTNQVLLQPLSAEQPACRLALPCQPRSLAVIGSCSSGQGNPGGSCGGTFLVVGSSSGEVLWWQLAVQRDAFGGSTGLRLVECGWARAGLAPVTLHLLPPAAASRSNSGCSSAQDLEPAGPAAAAGGGAAPGPASRPALLAISDQALLLGPDPVRPDRLAPARLHGGQGLAAACPLVTAELPGGSLAYVQGGQLHIGGLDPAVQLRWDELPLVDGAVASAAVVLAGCGMAAVACAEPQGGSSLRLVDASSLHQLARLTMPAEHTITALAAANLPCSVGAKEFLLVALCADNMAAASSGQAADEELPAASTDEAAAAGSSQPWWRQQPADEPQPAPGQQGQQAGSSSSQLQPASVLRVYEVRRRQQPEPAAGSGGNSAGRGHELVLHGSCPLPTAAFSLAAVQADVQPYGAWIAGSPAGSGVRCDAGSAAERASALVPTAAGERLLAAGCHDGTVRLFRMYIDDEGLEAQQAVQQGLADIAAAAVQPLRLSAEPGQRQAGQADGTECSDMGSHSQQAPRPQALSVPMLSRRLWHGRVALQLVAKAPTCFEGLPTSLAAAGSTLYALDLLSSLTAFRVQPLAAGQPPSLVPLAADVAGHHVSAMLPLGHAGRAVLAGLADGGLLLLQRDEAAERQRHAAAKHRWDSLREVGGAGGEEAAAPAARPSSSFTPSLREATALEPLSVAGPLATGAPGPGGSSGMAGILPGVLGVPLRRFGELAELGSHGCSPSSGPGGSGGGCAALQVGTTAGEALALRFEPATVVCTNGSVLTARAVSPEEHGTLQQLQKAAELTADHGASLTVGPSGAAGGVAGTGAPGTALDGSLLVAAYTQAAWQQRLLQAAPAEAVQRGRCILEAQGLL